MKGALSSEPGPDGFADWFEFLDAYDFLEASLTGFVPVHLNQHGPFTSVYLAGVFIPAEKLTPTARKELLEWNTDVIAKTWGWGGGFHDDGSPNYSLIPPFGWERPAILQEAVPIVWRRENSLEKGRPTYYEVNPELTHVHDLHLVKGRSAYCTLDELGDIREVIKIHRESDEEERTTEITVEHEVLAKHMALGDYALVRFFDIDRYRSIEAAGAVDMAVAETARVERKGIRAELVSMPLGDQLVRAHLRGVQLIPPPQGKLKEALLDDRSDREYESFIAWDFRHRTVDDFSCSPDELDSYWEDTGKPFETTPAFFRREVLAKYKSDSDKYTVSDRRIDCRSSWTLRYDVNDAGQVHAYLCDLQHLPYAEQKYWRSFNEEPQGGISDRSFKTDFEGRWDFQPEPLRDLKARLRSPIRLPLSEDDYQTIWMPPKDDRLWDEVQYLAGESQREWGDSIGALHRLVVEGLSPRVLRRIAEDLGEDPDDLKDLRSIKLLGRVIRQMGMPEEDAAEVIQTLGLLHHLRSKVASHRKGEDAKDLAQDARDEHGDLATHFRELVRRVDAAIQQVSKLSSYASKE